MFDRHRAEAAEAVLPRIIPDTHHDSHEEALKEVRRRATDVASAVTRIRKSPYGGYIVRSIPLAAVAQMVQAGSGSSILIGDPRGYDNGYPDE